MKELKTAANVALYKIWNFYKQQQKELLWLMPKATASLWKDQAIQKRQNLMKTLEEKNFASLPSSRRMATGGKWAFLTFLFHFLSSQESQGSNTYALPHPPRLLAIFPLSQSQVTR